jgi:Na+/proline symporter
MKAKLVVHFGSETAALSVLPVSVTPHGIMAYAWMPLLTLGVYLSVQWWAAWYPGAEPGGGGFVAQRIFCAKDEKHSLLATLWFTVAHYAIRPWPWILTALASLVLYPSLADKEAGFIRTIVDPSVFPPALAGLMIAAFAAAYMSTVATQLNWGASYLINDFYRRFLVRDATDRHYVRASQVATLALMAASTLATYYQESIAGAWKFLLSIGAGTGSVFILRWFWWRINAWSEVTAMAASFAVSLVLQFGVGLDANDPRQFAWTVLLTVACSTAAWLTVTLLTPAEPRPTLLAFYRRVQPSAALWGPIAREASDVEPRRDALWNLLDWAAGCVMVYMALFGVGRLIFGQAAVGLGYLLVATAGGGLLYWSLTRRGWKVIS